MESVGEEELKAELKKKSEFLQKVSGIDKNNETVLIRGGKMEGACIEAEVGSDSIKVNIEENKSCNKRKVKDDCFGGVDRRRSKRLTVDRG